MAIPKPRIRYHRPEILSGTTYKIQPPSIDDAVYITISNGEIDDELRPVELFINCKRMENFQWITALARLVSAQLQQPGLFPEFVIKELQDTVDPMGPYFIPGSSGKKAPSLVAHIGIVLEDHCKALGIALAHTKGKPQ